MSYLHYGWIIKLWHLSIEFYGEWQKVDQVPKLPSMLKIWTTQAILVASFPGSPLYHFSVMQVTESWAGLGNEATILVKSPKTLKQKDQIPAEENGWR